MKEVKYRDEVIAALRRYIEKRTEKYPWDVVLEEIEKGTEFGKIFYSVIEEIHDKNGGEINPPEKAGISL